MVRKIKLYFEFYAKLHEYWDSIERKLLEISQMFLLQSCFLLKRAFNK